MAFRINDGAPAPKQTPTQALNRAIANPRAAAKAFLKLDAENRLRDYARLVWPILEPRQPLIVSKPFEAICEHLEAVTKGQIRNLLINVPPGMSKSMLVSVLWPSWEWGPRNRPDLRYISWSYAQHLSKRDNERCRDLIKHPLYQALWGDRFQIKKDSNEKVNYKTNKHGFRFASSITGVGTGERGDRLLIDDPHDVSGAESEAELRTTINWFTGTLTSRVRNANKQVMTIDGMRVEPSATVVIMQRLGMNDVSGVIIENDLDFEHLLIEMEYEGANHPRRKMPSWRPSTIGYKDWRTQDGELADPVRFPREAVEEQKKKMLLKQGSNAVASQFRQWPFEGTGSYFKREWFKFCDPHEVPAGRADDVRGWDWAASIASTADKTAAVRMRWGRDGRLYVMHATGIRGTPGDVDTLVKSLAMADGRAVRQSIPQDPGAAGKHHVAYVIRELLQGYRVHASPESGSKEKRAEPLSAQAQHGNVVIVRGAWNEDFIRELCEFPVGQHDDFVDAATRAYESLVVGPSTGTTYTPKLYEATPD
jgi:predicted phage terminase large subunit-like protein